MAVKKIRRISSWTLLTVTGISFVILGLFYFGGVDAPLGEFKAPTYTGELLLWSYILLVICAVGMLFFGIFQFGVKFTTNPKNALVTLGVFVVFGALLIAAYMMGDGSLLPLSSASDAQKFNVPFWLKTTDMWLYAIYSLLVMAGFAMVWGSVKKILSK